jgi:branched-chain amino acid transport system ATP-binding protein
MMLEMAEIEAGYGEAQVLFGVGLAIAAGEVVTLLGRNGMGKTTTVRTMTGLLPARRGSIRLDGRSIERHGPHRIARAGLGLVPEGRRIFGNLTVRENLTATARPGEWTGHRILGLFPRLGERLGHWGNQLSGGEQQMLAIGRALMTNPRLLILDEATEGLAPLIRQEIWACLAALKASGLAILLIDKHVQAVGRLADRHYVIEKGRIVWSGSSAELASQPEIVSRYVGI